MQPTIHVRNVKLTPRLQAYVEKKTERLERYMPNIADLRVDLASQKARNSTERMSAQLTVRDARGTILRAEEQNADIYAAVDTVIDKMYRQIKRYRGKRRRARRHGGNAEEIAVLDEPLPIDVEDDLEDTGIIVRRKQFSLQPMSAEEAIDQMELVGHDFFVFFNSENDAVNVVYKRNDGQYGLLEPELD